MKSADILSLFLVKRKKIKKSFQEKIFLVFPIIPFDYNIYQPILHKCFALDVSSIQNGGIFPSANQLVGIRFRPYDQFKVSNMSLK